MTIFHPGSSGLLGGLGSQATASSLTSNSSGNSLSSIYDATAAQARVLSAMQAQQAAMQQAQGTANEQMAAQIFNSAIPYITVVSTGNINQGFVSFAQAAGFDTPPRNNPYPPSSTDAVNRSMELLCDWLTVRQLKDMAAYRYFYVQGGDTGRLYRINAPAPYNIYEYSSDGTMLAKWCFTPRDTTLPMGDIWLTQKLSLELDEAATLALANRSVAYNG